MNDYFDKNIGNCGRRSKARGFTLIELMIVVATIGILVSVAIPAYQNYAVRAKASEVVMAASACRTPVSDVYQSGVASMPANGWGCESLVSSSRYVSSVVTNVDGHVTVTARNLGPEIDGKVLTLVPVDEDGQPLAHSAGAVIHGWICGGFGTTIDAKYLPGSCQGH